MAQGRSTARDPASRSGSPWAEAGRRGDEGGAKRIGERLIGYGSAASKNVNSRNLTPVPSKRTPPPGGGAQAYKNWRPSVSLPLPGWCESCGVGAGGGGSDTPAQRIRIGTPYLYLSFSLPMGDDSRGSQPPPRTSRPRRREGQKPQEEKISRPGTRSARGQKIPTPRRRQPVLRTRGNPRLGLLVAHAGRGQGPAERPVRSLQRRPARLLYGYIRRVRSQSGRADGWHGPAPPGRFSTTSIHPRLTDWYHRSGQHRIHSRRPGRGSKSSMAFGIHRGVQHS